TPGDPIVGHYVRMPGKEPETDEPEMTMRLIDARRAMRLLLAGLLASTACATPLFAPPSAAQTAPAAAPTTPPAADMNTFSLALDITLRLAADKTGEQIETRRIKVLGAAAVQRVAQQSLQYTEGMQSFEIVEAYTEKPDGSKVQVDRATVLVRDPATGLGAV